MRPPALAIDRVAALAPACHRTVVPDAWLDVNGHMNVRWYQVLFDEAGDELHLRLGLTPEFHAQHGTGTMDLEHHINFINEALAGETLAVYARLIATTPKRLHYMLFAVNETRGNLASIFECINAFVDKKARKMAVFPPEIVSRVERQVAIDSALEWPPPVCGAMKP